MLSTESGFSANIYFAAAQERITEANLLLESSPPRHALACYSAGVAVECLLRSYRMRTGFEEDDTRHNVQLLAERSNFYVGLSSKEKERISGYVGEVFKRWRNDFRYRNDIALRTFITRNRLFIVTGSKATRQDVVAFHSGILVEAATQIVSSGVRRWEYL